MTQGKNIRRKIALITVTMMMTVPSLAQEGKAQHGVFTNKFADNWEAKRISALVGSLQRPAGNPFSWKEAQR